MTLSPSTIKSTRIKKNTKRVGRGNGSGKGTYCTRGLKGQNSRSGNSGNARRAFKASLQKIPKLRGFRSLALKAETVSISSLEKICKEGQEVTPIFLKEKGLISQVKNGVKIVANGELKKKIICKDCLASKTAKEMIEKVGGQIVF